MGGANCGIVIILPDTEQKWVLKKGNEERLQKGYKRKIRKGGWVVEENEEKCVG